jgi:hypothetical protein
MDHSATTEEIMEGARSERRWQDADAVIEQLVDHEEPAGNES